VEKSGRPDRSEKEGKRGEKSNQEKEDSIGRSFKSKKGK
jgi:hypothetical protein